LGCEAKVAVLTKLVKVAPSAGDAVVVDAMSVDLIDEIVSVETVIIVGNAPVVETSVVNWIVAHEASDVASVVMIEVVALEAGRQGLT